MATGDQNNILTRLQSYLPNGWFGDLTQTPVLNSLLNGISSVMATIYMLIMFFWAQTRLQTSSGGYVDLWAADFLGNSLPRLSGETDTAYINRIKINVFQQRATRQAMINVLTSLTGRVPVIFEPGRPLDSGTTGSLASPSLTNPAGFCGVARCGSMGVPFSALITAYLPNIGGGSSGAGYMHIIGRTYMNASPSLSYTGSLSQETSSANAAAIYAAINATRPVGTNIGVYISN